MHKISCRLLATTVVHVLLMPLLGLVMLVLTLVLLLPLPLVLGPKMIELLQMVLVTANVIRS
jgi:hypothetical protein